MNLNDLGETVIDRTKVVYLTREDRKLTKFVPSVHKNLNGDTMSCAKSGEDVETGVIEYYIHYLLDGIKISLCAEYDSKSLRDEAFKHLESYMK